MDINYNSPEDSISSGGICMTSTQAAQLQAIYDNLGSISVDKGSYTFTFTFSTTFNSYTGKLQQVQIH